MLAVRLAILLLSLTGSLSLSWECIGSISGLLEKKILLVKALDSWGKPVGALRGSFTSLGDLEECVSLVDDSEDGFNFTYNLVEGDLVVAGNVLPSSLGVCLPSTCDTEDVKDVVNQIIEYIKGAIPGDGSDQVMMTSKVEAFYKQAPFTLLVSNFVQDEQLNFSYNVTNVHPFGKVEWSASAITFLSCLVIIVLFSVGATILEYVLVYALRAKDKSTPATCDITQEEGKPPKEYLSSSSSDTLAEPLEDTPLIIKTQEPPERSFLFRLITCFSLYSTIPSLFRGSPQAHEEVNLFNVFKVISLLWAMLGVTFLLIMDIAPVDLKTVLEMTDYSAMMILSNSPLSLDTFLFTTAFFAAYLTFSKNVTRKMFNYIDYVFSFLFRVTPLYAITLFTWFFLFPLMGNGPVWFKQVDSVESTCSRFWWTNLLYINNFYPTETKDVCVPWSWFMSINFQLYLLLPLFIVPLWFGKCWKYFGFLALILAIIAASCTSALLTMKYSIPTVLFDRDAKGMPLFLKEFLTKPYNHLNSSTIGVIFAYYSFSLRKRRVTISRLVTPLLQILGGVLLLVTLYLPFVIRNATEELKETEKDHGIYMNAAYNGLSRIFWALGLGLLALPSVVSPESTHILTRFASWRGWAVLGRLTFSMYLVHIIVLHVFFGTVLREYPFRLASLFLSLGGIFLWSCLLGSCLYVFIQSPLANLVKLVTKVAK
ncbi:hypothetical protein MP638_005753 [Amoeboaphelidium occidentale]|nr:hypothetical protein MP638_005753 [Amoeboaphelidium occidentale]